MGDRAGGEFVGCGVVRVRASTGLCSLPFNGMGACLFILLFITKGVTLPRLYRLIPTNNPALLPVCFFALVTTCGCNFGMNLLATLLSPIVGRLLFTVPTTTILPTVLVGSNLLTKATTLTTHCTGGVSLLTLLNMVLSCRVVNATFR